MTSYTSTTPSVIPPQYEQSICDWESSICVELYTRCLKNSRREKKRNAPVVAPSSRDRPNIQTQGARRSGTDAMQLKGPKFEAPSPALNLIHVIWILGHFGNINFPRVWCVKDIIEAGFCLQVGNR